MKTSLYHISNQTAVIEDSIVFINSAGEGDEKFTLCYAVKAIYQAGVFYLTTNGDPVELSENNYDAPNDILSSYPQTTDWIRESFDTTLANVSEDTQDWWTDWADTLDDKFEELEK
jgi:hypothetical protein